MILVFLLSSTGFFYLFNKKIQNIYYSLNKSTISKDLLIVEIDDETLDIDRKEDLGLGRFPFDRSSYVPVIENLNKEGVAVIGFDIIFADKTNTNSDQILFNSIKEAGNVLIGSYFSKKGYFNESLFSDAIWSTGFFNPIIDPLNQVVYSVKPFAKSKDGSYYTHFSFSVLKAYYSYIYGKDYTSFEPKNDKYFHHLLPNKKIPLSSDGKNEVLINYSKYSQFGKDNKIISFIDVYDQSRFDELKKDINFKDKIVLIGATATGIKDIFYTPNGIEYGVYTHANIINTVLNLDYIRYFNKTYELILIFLLIILSVYFNMSRSGYVLIFSNIAIVSIFLVIFPTLIILYTNLITNYTFELIFSLIFSLILSNVIKYIIENKNKIKLNKALSEYVSSDVANEILSGEGNINLDGENKDTVIFFSDIEGFTTISEKFSPEELVSFLREYLSNMSDIIMDQKGFINKYEGDAIMALWGVVGEYDSNNTYYACLSALKQQKLLKELNKGWSKKGFTEIKARIGLHKGNAIVGNIGSEGRKMEFTALGDSVNLASRLEGVNKFYGTYICVGESIYEIEKENFEFRYLDRIKVKGKNTAVKIYELLGLKGEVSDNILNIKNEFEKATSLYLERDFNGAKIIFSKLIKMGDNAGRTYLDMCNIYIKTPPPKDWDGISTMSSK